MSKLLLTLLLSLFFATQVMAVQPTSSDEKLAMNNQIPEGTPDGESEDSLDDESDEKKKNKVESTPYPDGESEDESDDKAKEKKD